MQCSQHATTLGNKQFPKRRSRKPQKDTTGYKKCLQSVPDNKAARNISHLTQPMQQAGDNNGN